MPHLMTLRRDFVFGIVVAALITATAASPSWMPEAWYYFALYNDLGPLISKSDSLAHCSNQLVREEVQPARKD
jgi:hypothetical protein